MAETLGCIIIFTGATSVEKYTTCALLQGSLKVQGFFFKHISKVAKQFPRLHKTTHSVDCVQYEI